MNNKGFAISTILYGLIIMVINVMFIIIVTVKDRYDITTDLKDNIINQLNNMEQ